MTPRRRWPLAAGAVGLVAGLAAVVVLTREPAVTVLPAVTPSPSESAAAAGAWKLTHSLALPPGWHLNSQQVRARSSTSELAGPPREGPPYCTVTVLAAGETMVQPAADAGTPVLVRGTPGVYAPVDRHHRDGPHGVFWQGPGGGWANAWCEGGRTPSLAAARLVRFRATTVAVPVRLEALPAGYRPESIRLRLFEPESDDDVTLLLRPRPGADEPPLALWSSRRLPTVTPPRSAEHVLIAGRPGVASAFNRSVCLTDGQLICLGEEQTDPMGNDDSWPPGVRDLLLGGAQGVVGATDPADRSTWFEGRQAFPG